MKRVPSDKSTDDDLNELDAISSSVVSQSSEGEKDVICTKCRNVVILASSFCAAIEGSPFLCSSCAEPSQQQQENGHPVINDDKVS